LEAASVGGLSYTLVIASNRAIALKMSDVQSLPAIVLRNDQQDALGMGLGDRLVREKHAMLLIFWFVRND